MSISSEINAPLALTKHVVQMQAALISSRNLKQGKTGLHLVAVSVRLKSHYTRYILLETQNVKHFSFACLINCSISMTEQ